MRDLDRRVGVRGDSNYRRGDSFGMKCGATASEDGYVYYGVVRVENNFLALYLRNWARPGQLNRFAGVVLTPRDRTAGRININTADTRYYVDKNGQYRMFNPMMGLPGMLLSMGTGSTGAPQPETILDSFAPPSFSFPNLEQGVGGLDIWKLPIPSLILDPNVDDSDPIRTDTDQRRNEARLYRARLIEYGRPVHNDGRYYETFEDLISERQDDNLCIPFQHPNLPNNDPRRLYPLSIKQDRNDRFDYSLNRLSPMLNSITLRSDVFEIIVTVQAGYGVDANGDGLFNYRSSEEFIVNAEKKSRTVYER
jgi:hypothetical protein